MCIRDRSRLSLRPLDGEPDIERDPAPLVEAASQVVQIVGLEEVGGELRRATRLRSRQRRHGLALRRHAPARELDQWKELAELVPAGHFALEVPAAQRHGRRGVLADHHLESLGQEWMEVVSEDRLEQMLAVDLGVWI